MGLSDITEFEPEKKIVEYTISGDKSGKLVAKTVTDFDNELAPGESGAFVLENARLLRALGQAVAAEPAVHLIAPDQVTGFATDGFGITAQLRSGGEIRAALLVAADGRASRLRDMAGIKTVHWSYEQKGIVGTVAHEKPHGGKAVQHFLPAGPFARLPLTGNRSSIVWSEESHETDRIMALGDDDFLAELSRRFGTALGPLSLAGPHQAFPLSLHLARSFIAPRFALIGDSAHGVHPLAGQGLNIGFRDVAALTEVLVETARLGLDLGGTVPLERYERWRRFDSAISALAMDLMNRAFSNDVAGLRALRDQGLRLVNRVPQLKAFFVREAAGQTGDVPRLLQGKPL